MIPCYSLLQGNAAIDTVAITPAWVGSFVVNVALEIEDSVDFFPLFFPVRVGEEFARDWLLRH